MENDFQQAFPTQHVVADANDPAFKLGSRGMSLRDYFAAAALQGMLAYPMPGNPKPEVIAGWAYAQADAMLAARERKEGSNG